MIELKPKRSATFWVITQIDKDGSIVGVICTPDGLYHSCDLYTTKKAANRSKRELIQEDSSRRGTLKVQKIKLLLENS